MKKRNVLVLALAALLLLSLTVLIVPGWGAAQQSKAADKQKDMDLVKRLEEARQEAERAKLEAAELRQQLEKERKRAVQAEVEARAERDAARKAEAEARRRAEQALVAAEAARRETEQSLLEAKKAAERQRYAAAVQAAHAAFAKGTEKAKGEEKPLPPALEQAKANVVNAFNQKRAELLFQLKRLDEEQHKMLAELERTALLVQLLERLERIERRLDRLERNQPSAPQQPKKQP